MSAFVDLRRQFDVNWTTILVGWRGLGVLSPWPDQWKEFPPFVSVEELEDYARARLNANSGQDELDAASTLLVCDLLDSISEPEKSYQALEPRKWWQEENWWLEETRGIVCDQLDRLSVSDKADPALELRKWRLVLLEYKLEDLPNDPIYGPIELSEFWSDFGFPSDSPHEAQGVGNSLSPSEFYTQENLERLLSRHQAWIRDERESIKKASLSFSTHPAS